MTDRKDLPSPKAANFGERVRETMQEYLGVRGDPLNRGITLRDLVDSGIAKLPPGWRPGSGDLALTPGAAGSGSGSGTQGPPGPPGPPGQGVEPDLTPPPQPDGFTAAAAISHVLIEHNAPLYTQGNGHLRTRVYGVVVPNIGTLATFDAAVEVLQFSGTVGALASNPGTTWRLWIKWETNDGVLSPTPAGGANGVAVTTGQDVSSMVAAMTGPGNPFTVLLAPTVIDGVTFPAGTYSQRAFIQDAQITNAKIANLAVDDAKIASLSVAKLTAGSIAVGQFIQSTSYAPGSSGWRINGDGTAEFSGVVVRGTVFANAGLIGGITIAANAVRAGQTGFNTGQGFHLGSDGRFSLGSGTGNRLTWDGSSLTLTGALNAATGTFSGSLSAATGTFAGNVSGGQFTTGAYTGYAWPPAGAGNIGSYLGPGGLLLGNANNGKYFQVEADGDIFAPGFNVQNGVLTINQANVINTLNIAGNAVSATSSASGNAFTVSTTMFIPAGQVMRIVATAHFGAAFTNSSGDDAISISISGNTISSLRFTQPVSTGAETSGLIYPNTTLLHRADIAGNGSGVTISCSGGFGAQKTLVVTGHLR